MYFKTLKEKCEYYRSLTDYKLMPNSYVLVMVDGHCFSKMIKNKFEKPFDDEFIRMMNETAMYLCESIQGAKFAYTQSDEISILITDFDTPKTDSFFSFRLCKMQSLIAAMATAKFNQLYAISSLAKEINTISKDGLNGQKIDFTKTIPLCTFDCKVWTVPNANDAYAWFLYRQTDCIKNSKAQTAQTFIPHDTLKRLNADEMINLCKETKGIDWYDYPNDRKYGRIIKKVETPPMEKDLPNGQHIVFTRNVWTPVPATDLRDDDTMVRDLIPNPYPGVYMQVIEL